MLSQIYDVIQSSVALHLQVHKKDFSSSDHELLKKELCFCDRSLSVVRRQLNFFKRHHVDVIDRSNV